MSNMMNDYWENDGGVRVRAEKKAEVDNVEVEGGEGGRRHVHHKLSLSIPCDDTDA